MYTPQETKEMRCSIALELARFKMQVRVAQGYQPRLDDNDLNELFTVAGLPLLEPGELEQEVELINIQKEDKE
jgi:hypothetical protein